MLLTDGLVSRSRFALVIVDIQQRLAAAMRCREEVVENTVKVARAAALVGAPIVVTMQNPDRLGGGVGELDIALDALEAQGASVLRLEKTAFCCCREAGFTDAVAALGRDQMVLTGMETHICVTQTAIGLAGAGYSVHVAADACCSRHQHDHDLALERLRAAGIVVSSAEAVMYEAVERAATDEFRELLRIVKSEQ